MHHLLLSGRFCSAAGAALVLFALGATPADAATRNISAGSNLQAAVDAAVPGDTLLLEAGAMFVGPIWLRPKSGYENSTEWITIRTSTPDGVFPTAGTRVAPSHAPLMAKIASPGNNWPALITEPYAHHFRFIGIEIATVAPTDYVRELIRFGEGATAIQTSMAMVPHHFDVQRCYIHGHPTQEVVRGIALQSGSTTVVDSYISDIKHSGYDTQALEGWNGPGPFDIINNYLEASGETIGIGGEDPGVPGLIPSDIRILRNHLFKPLSWRGKYLVKNHFEIKAAQRVLVEGNVFENNWAGGQAGFAVLLNVRNVNTCTWCTMKDVTFRNNIIKNTSSGFQILGKDDRPVTSVRADNIVIENNLIYGADVTAWGGDGIFVMISTAPTRLRIAHNTIIGNNMSMMVGLAGEAGSGFVFKDNLMSGFNYGFHGQVASGFAAIPHYLPGATIQGNVFGFTVPSLYATALPAGNFLADATALPGGFADAVRGTYSLATNSPYRDKATDGTDVGVNMTQLNAALAGVVRSPSPPANLRVVQ